MYGTVARWVQKFSEWNPALTEADCFLLIESLFGLRLPKVASLLDMERGFPPEFFSEVVYDETRRAIEAVRDLGQADFLGIHRPFAPRRRRDAGQGPRWDPASH